MVDKSDIAGFINNADLDLKIRSNISNKSWIKSRTRQKSDSSYFQGKNHFEDDGTQNYLVFQPMYKYFLKVCDTDRISEWKSKRLRDEIIKCPTTSNNSLALH